MKCQCRNCYKEYESNKSRAEWTGYCSAKCQHQMARELGYQKGTHTSEYEVLQACQEIGDVPVESERVRLRAELAELESSRYHSSLHAACASRITSIKRLLATTLN